ncbi:MAG: DMT family transporter [Pseudomonadales bacterium]|nr:DMT family transporter [Pseudomonadales bacterium]
MGSITSRQRWTGTLLVLVSTAGFSAKSIFAKLAYRYGCDALTLVSWRMLLSLPFFLLAIFWATRNPDRPTLRREDMISIGLLGVAGYYLSSILDFEGLMFISASLERLALFLYPTLVVILDLAFNDKPMKRRTFMALLLSYCGIALVVIHGLSHQHGTLLGTMLVMGSALSYACYLLGSQPLIQRLGSLRFTGLTLCVASICVLLQTLIQEGPSAFHISLPIFWLALATALISTVMPVFLLTAGIARIGSQQAALIGSIGPVATMFLGLWLLHEPITLLQFFGAILVTGGVMVVSRG